jgi:hypothetical protein
MAHGPWRPASELLETRLLPPGSVRVRACLPVS